jgi:hypothetical protein
MSDMTQDEAKAILSKLKPKQQQAFMFVVKQAVDNIACELERLASEMREAYAEESQTMFEDDK